MLRPVSEEINKKPFLMRFVMCLEIKLDVKII